MINSKISSIFHKNYILNLLRMVKTKLSMMIKKKSTLIFKLFQKIFKLKYMINIITWYFVIFFICKTNLANLYNGFNPIFKRRRLIEMNLFTFTMMKLNIFVLCLKAKRQLPFHYLIIKISSKFKMVMNLDSLIFYLGVQNLINLS